MRGDHPVRGDLSPLHRSVAHSRVALKRASATTEPQRTSPTRRRLQLKLDAVLRSRILALPSLSSFPALPDGLSGEGVDPGPMQRPILFARRNETVQGLGGPQRALVRRKSLQACAVALKDESMAFVPLDVKRRELLVGRSDRSAVPDRTRPESREDLRRGRNRERSLARDEREPKRVLEIDAHVSGFFKSSSPDGRIIAAGAKNGSAIHRRISEGARGLHRLR